jgi:hypothetical protein
MSPATSAIRATAATTARRTLLRQQPRRLYSAPSAPPSGTGEKQSFYKTFSRPVFKVGLMAIFTYQLAYYAWVRLETDEAKAEAAGTS